MILEDTSALRQSSPQRLRDDAIHAVSILGSTGSVGKSTLDVIAHANGRFRIVALTAQRNVDQLAEQAIAHHAQLAVIGDPSLLATLRDRLAGTGIATAAGEDGLMEAATRPTDCVVAAIVGAAGLKATFAAVATGARLALANKECLVSAGDVFMDAVAAADAELLPVDSEHSAVFQAINGHVTGAIDRIVLTASGGPFRTWSAEEIAKAGPKAALRHPSWTMGPKITIDSATMMNKGLELIEAYHLFPVQPDQLDILVHPQSIIHCLVEYVDGSVMAQLAMPDMCTPIAYALSFPSRIPTPTQRLDLATLGQLSFSAPDEVRFPAIRLAREAMTRGGTAAAVLNAANEIAVEAFLATRIGFTEISESVEKVLNLAEQSGLIYQAGCLDDVIDVDGRARRMTQDLLNA
jgi:1-deoxy-D-xylulose-5-phosphate reductoisomerase